MLLKGSVRASATYQLRRGFSGIKTPHKMCYTIIILLSYPISVSDVVTEFHQRQKRVSKPSSAHFGPIRNDPESDKFNQYGYFSIFKNSYLQKYYLYQIGFPM